MADVPVIDTVDLRKRYDEVEALRGLTLQVPPGSICGFLGRNGAGKTTTIKILLGMVRPTSGRALVFGLDAGSAAASVDIRRRTGFVSEDKELYGYMSVDEIIRFTAAFFPRWRRDLERRYRDAFALPAQARISALSRGMRTKLAVLLALCRSADLLVLDEPTSGLDPAAIEQVLQALVLQVASEGGTVFFSSHQIAEIEQIADRVAIVDAGRMVLAGALDDLRERYRRVRLVFDQAAPAATFRAPGITRIRRDGRVITLLSGAGTDLVVEEGRALGPLSIDVTPVTLRELFLDTVVQEG